MNRAPLDDRPHRVTKPFFTFGTLALLIVMGVGFSFGVTRLLLGLGSVTNLDDHNPWGIWISFDVACGVALAAGGFTTAALVDIFGRRRYRALLPLPDVAPPRRTEAIQHGIFRFGAIPIAVYGLLAALMWRHQRREAAEQEGSGHDAPLSPGGGAR